MKTICLDYDGSYNTFPELFDLIVKKALADGHLVILATMRYEAEKDDGLVQIEKKGVRLIFTGRMGKKKYLARIGIKPDLWIDDNPEWILHDAMR